MLIRLNERQKYALALNQQLVPEKSLIGTKAKVPPKDLIAIPQTQFAYGFHHKMVCYRNSRTDRKR
jgi:hypothetical protein